MRAYTLLALLIVAVSAFTVGRAAEPYSSFRILVAFDPATNKVELKCTAGCAWTDLSFGCEQGSECQSPIDEYGMSK